ncbi:hypothetical protein [uncultured Dokdonia sp.]|uniref:hypothetical protein n=1 Tax=uncultured Dokdonia sp. TaxID=575653 RepID=UPI002605204E|nr:hypothetical protein [uncultured Dokdonia sp.]
MKNLYKYVFMGILALGLGSCDDDEENVTVVVQDTVETGAVLRTIQVISNELPIGLDAGFSVQIEEQDEQEGALLQSVDVFATFADNSPDDGDTTGANFNEFSLGTVDASEFTDPSPFGLPRATLNYSSDVLNAGAGVTGAQLFGGDTFTIRLSLNLTDGRVFSVNNAGGIITAGFFNSPFQYTATVTCPVEGDFAVGTYQLSIIEGVFPAFDATIDWIEEPVTIVNGTGDTERIIESACYLPEFGTFCGPLTFNLVCGSVILPNQAPGGGVGCGAAILLESDLSDLGSYDPADDSTIQLIFQNNFEDAGGCGADQYRQVLELTRI